MLPKPVTLPPQVIPVFIFPSIGTDDLRWKAELHSLSPARTLILSQVVLTLVLDDDGDGILDAYEASNNLDPLVNNSAGDNDNDGLINLEQYQYNTEPNDLDSDNDGMSDGFEIAPWFGS